MPSAVSAPVSGASHAAMQELLAGMHSMAGAAATFGLPRVGDAALELERVLQRMCPHRGVPGVMDRSQIENRIAQLLQVATRSSKLLPQPGEIRSAV